jgi:hypothetical protein
MWIGYSIKDNSESLSNKMSSPTTIETSAQAINELRLAFSDAVRSETQALTNLNKERRERIGLEGKVEVFELEIARIQRGYKLLEANAKNLLAEKDALIQELLSKEEGMVIATQSGTIRLTCPLDIAMLAIQETIIKRTKTDEKIVESVDDTSPAEVKTDPAHQVSSQTRTTPISHKTSPASPSSAPAHPGDVGKTTVGAMD